jgi:L-methionine (R)-S-oxide reductase
LQELQLKANSNKEENYKNLIPQIEALVLSEKDLIANLANISAALKSAFNWWWVGFYLVKQNELILGPFQGPVACTRIGIGRGVCGSAWQQAQTIIVADVEKFPGHIACSSASKSEIVVPIIINNHVIGVLDIDSELLNHFDETDQLYLEKLIRNISSIF